MSAKKVLLILAALVVLGLAAVALAVAVFLPPYIEERVVLEARKRGVELTPGDVSLRFGALRITDSHVALIGVRGIRADVGLIDAELAGFVPQRFTLGQVKVVATGDPLLLFRQLEAWDRAHAPSTREPVAVNAASLVVRKSEKAPPELSAHGANATFAGGRLFVRAKTATVLGRNLGELRLVREKGALRADVTLGQGSLDNPSVSVETRDEADRVVHVGLSPMRLSDLGKTLGVELPRPEVLASGTLDLTVPRNLTVGARIHGRSDLVLKGYVPPHPVELDGFVFGDTTTVGARFVLEPELLRARLEEIRVKAGRFELTGTGQLALEGDHGRLLLGLRGELPCPELANAAARSRLGQALGRVTGKAARQVLLGSVGVRVSIDADTRALRNARVLRTITAGCGLKPLTLKELVALGELVPEALDPRVGDDLIDLFEKGLPPLPAGVNLELKVPNLGALPVPALPRFEIDGGGGRRTR